MLKGMLKLKIKIVFAWFTDLGLVVFFLLSGNYVSLRFEKLAPNVWALNAAKEDPLQSRNTVVFVAF